MGETCKDCKSWEEEIFWTHFQSIHFSQFLRTGFDQQLAIPEKFATHFKKKLPETVTLKGPSGITWNVKLTTNNDTLFFNHGWQEFVRENSLEENDLLIFKYNGMSHFDVLMFDGRSLCEKATSYFVRRCGHTEHDSGCQTKRKERETSVDVIHISSHCGVGGTPPEKSPSDDTGTIPLGQPIQSPTIIKKTRKGGCSITPGRRSIRRKKLFGNDAEVKAKADAEHTAITVTNDSDAEHTSINKNELSSTKYASNRRPVTEVEKKNALHLAQAAATDDGFIVVMKPTHVYKRFYMSIPSGWMNKHLSLENQDVILRANENTWRVRFNYNKPRNNGGLTGSWKNFALDNNLEEFDVCRFEPAGLAANPIILDVSFFRVVNEVIPLTQVPLPSLECETDNGKQRDLIT